MSSHGETRGVGAQRASEGFVRQDNSEDNNSLDVEATLILFPHVLRLERKNVAEWLKRHKPPKHLRGLLEAVRDFACRLQQVYQSPSPFEVPVSQPWIVVIGDDMWRSLGPNGFHEPSLRALFAECSFVGIVTGTAIPEPYNLAATWAVRARANAAVVETQPEHKDAWLTLAREMNPSVSVLLCLPEEALQ